MKIRIVLGKPADDRSPDVEASCHKFLSSKDMPPSFYEVLLALLCFAILRIALQDGNEQRKMSAVITTPRVIYY